MTAEDRAVLQQFHAPLTETIKSETVLGRLVAAGVLSHEEKNSINLAPRNADRVGALLALLPRKPAHALDAFCEAIKFRHTTLHDQLVKARLLAQYRPGESSASTDVSLRSRCGKMTTQCDNRQHRRILGPGAGRILGHSVLSLQ